MFFSRGSLTIWNKYCNFASETTISEMTVSDAAVSAVIQD